MYTHEAALVHDRALHPFPSHSSTGMLLWNGSDGARLLDEDMAAGKHLQMKPEELFETRPEYLPFGKERFAKRIDQMKEKAKDFGATPGQASSKKRAAKLPTGLKERSRKHLRGPYINNDESNSKQEAVVNEVALI